MIYVFLANGFEEVEALTPVDMLRRCELDVLTVGVDGSFIRGSHGITVAADISPEDIRYDNTLEMIVLPGGMPGTLNLEKSEEVQKAIDFCMENNRYIASICAAPSILGHKGLLEGKKATCYTGFETQLFGAEISEEPVCTDGNIITSRGAGTALEFSFELVSRLISPERVKPLRETIIFPR